MTLPTTPGTLGRVRISMAATIRQIAAICVLAVTVFTLSVSAASAGTDESITTKRGSASFNDKDEIVTANDRLEDGIGIQAHVFWKIKTSSGTKTVSATVTDGNGANNSPNTKNLRIREGTKVRMKLCYVDGGIVTKCSRVQFATA
jgi:hypothetical protein